MSKSFNPLLAATLENLEDLTYPCLLTPKIDGIRCVILDSKAFSRKLITIPNQHVQNSMASLLDGLDGELIIPNNTYSTTQSQIMSEDTIPDFEYHIFDYFSNPDLNYVSRIAKLMELKPTLPKFCKLVLPIICNNQEEFSAFEKQCIKDGFEGVMIRSPNGFYKYGRSTLKEGILLKYKRFLDSEAEITGFLEEMKNTNEAEIDELGHKKRSKKLAQMVPKNTLGAFFVKDLKSGIEFKVSTGMTKLERQTFWLQKESLVGKVLKYRYQEIEKNKPRFPSFIGFRDKND